VQLERKLLSYLDDLRALTPGYFGKSGERSSRGRRLGNDALELVVALEIHGENPFGNVFWMIVGYSDAPLSSLG